VQKSLDIPSNEQAVRGLTAGDSVSLTGWIYTGRDTFHKYLAEGNPAPVSLTGTAIYHCGPVAVFSEGRWQIQAAGPTTSAREEPYMADIIRRFGIRAIIGKGGMGETTRQACMDTGCVYLHVVGGAAQYLAASVREVGEVYMREEFGLTEAVWELYVTDFPCVVTMDTHGNDLHEDIRRQSREQLREVLTDRYAISS